MSLIANEYNEIQIEAAHVLRVATLPPLHADPFDRILLAQAMAEGFVLLTQDAKVIDYGGPVWGV
jgi:PIN domain nuclease of toxin-antitoxin system